MPLVAAYTFDEGTGTTAADLMGGASITSVPGWATGLHDDAMFVNNVTGPTVTPFSADTNYTILLDVYIVGAGGSGYNIIINGGSNDWGQLQTNSAGYPNIGWYHGGPPEVAPVVGGLPLATWTNIAMRADGSTRKFYLNGTLAGTTTTSVRNAQFPFQLGGVGASFPGNFRIDNLQFWDEALSDAKIDELAGEPVVLPPIPANLDDTLTITDNLTVTTTGLYAVINDSLTISDMSAPQAFERTEEIADTLDIDDGVTVSGSAVVIAPVANAGLDQTVTPSTLVTLDGSASSVTEPRTITAYNWTQVSGPAVTLSGTGATRTFVPTINGAYVFGLTVTDTNPLTSAQDTVTVTVSSGGTTKWYYSDGTEWHAL